MELFRPFVTVTVSVTLALAGLAFSKAESQGTKLERSDQRQQTQLLVVCQEHKLLAAIAAETLKDQIKNSKNILPKISFPGLTHKQLEAITQQKLQREALDLGKLETVSVETC